ncbi:hypothetical protein D9M72_298300 [compost metagenome]
MRAVLLASATAATLKGRRFLSLLSHGCVLSSALRCMRTDIAPVTSKVLNWPFPIFEIPTKVWLAPLE